MRHARIAGHVRLAALLVGQLLAAGAVRAQETATAADTSAAEESESPFGIGVDLASQYVWRGARYSTKPNFQPHASVAWKSLELSTWGSYAVDGNWQEQDFTLAYSGDHPIGSLYFALNDYFYPIYGGAQARPFNYGGVKDGVATGAHTLELVGSWTTPRIPLTFLAGWNFYNDPDHAWYGEASIAPEVKGFTVTGTAGMALNTSAYYLAEAGQVVNLGLSVSRSFSLATRLGLTLTGAFVHNPAADASYFVLSAGALTQ